MAINQNQAAGAHRLTTAGAVAGLALSTALAFGRVFRGGEATWKLLAAAALSIGLAAVLERRSLLLATLASSALLMVALTWLVFPHTAWYGLPSSTTLRSVAEALERVGQQARVQVAPAPPQDPLLLAAVTAVWTASFSAHALAARAGSPLLAVLPLLALLGFADTVLEDGARPGYVSLFFLALLAVVFSDGLRRVRLWGPIWPSPGLRRRRIAPAMTRGARRVALLAVGAAVLLPGVLPGFGAPALVDFSSRTGGPVYIDPFVRVAAQLRQDEPKPLFEVRSAVPTYLRMLSLDRFDAATGTWTTDDPQLASAPTFSSGALLPPSEGVAGPAVHQEVRVLSDLGGRWIPVAYPAASITLADGEVRYDASLGAAVTTATLTAGTMYTAESHPFFPTRAELDQEVFGDPASYGLYAQVPEDLALDLRRIAEGWAGDPWLPPFERIWNIQQRLRDTTRFAYDDGVKPVDDGQALMRFLTVERRGFCQQYATAMALLVRSLGYPARVVVGFRQGTLSEPGVRLVTTKDAHTWVEVRFPTYGWLTFEPTPTRNAPGASAYLTAPASVGGAPAPGERSAPGGGKGLGLPQLDNVDRLRGRVRGLGGSGLGTPSPVPRRGGSRVGWLGLRVAGVLLVLFLLLFPPVKASLRRARLRLAARDPQATVLATYRLFVDRAADVGLGRGSGETPEEYRRRLRSRVAFSDGHLDRLTRTMSLAAYAPRPPGEETAREAKKDAAVAIRDVRRAAGAVKRVLGAYRLQI